MVALREAIGLSDVVFLLDGPLTLSVDYPARYVIDSEVVNIVGGKSTAAISVVRGIESTTIASHAKGAILTFAPDTGLDPTGVAISALPAVVTPAGTDEFPVNQTGQTMKMTLAQILSSATTNPTLRAILGIGSNFDSAILSIPGLAGYWRPGMAGVVRDWTGLRHHGAYVGSPTLGAAGGVIGDPGVAATWSGTGQYATVGGYNDPGGDMTALCLIKTPEVGGTLVAMGGKAGGANGDFYMADLTTGARINVVDASGNIVGQSATSLLDNNWHLLAGVVSGLDVSVSVDGVTGATHGTLSVPRPAGGTNWLGLASFGHAGTYPYKGTTDRHAIFQRALSAAELLNLWRIARAL